MTTVIESVPDTLIDSLTAVVTHQGVQSNFVASSTSLHQKPGEPLYCVAYLLEWQTGKLQQIHFSFAPGTEAGVHFFGPQNADVFAYYKPVEAQEVDAFKAISGWINLEFAPTLNRLKGTFEFEGASAVIPGRVTVKSGNVVVDVAARKAVSQGTFTIDADINRLPTTASSAGDSKGEKYRFEADSVVTYDHGFLLISGYREYPWSGAELAIPYDKFDLGELEIRGPYTGPDHASALLRINSYFFYGDEGRVFYVYDPVKKTMKGHLNFSNLTVNTFNGEFFVSGVDLPKLR